MLKNMQMYKKISLIISCVLIAGLLIIFFVTSTSTNATVSDITNARLMEAVDARSELVETYFEDYLQYFKSLATQGFVKDLLKNPSDPAAQAAALKELVAYKESKSNMEGVFIDDLDTVCLAHSVESAIGTPTVTNEADLAALPGNVAAGNGVYLKGIVTSTATGQLIAAVYCGVYDDDGTLIGYVGGGAFIDDLVDKINSMELRDLDNASVYLINMNRNNYMVTPNSEEFGADVTNAAHQQMMAMAASSNAGEYSFKDGGKKMAVYQTVADLGFLFIIEDAESEVFAANNRLSMVLAILSVVVLAVIIAVSVVVTMAISKDISRVGDVIKKIGTLDLTFVKELSRYEGRKDEVGEIAAATDGLATAVANSIRSIRVQSEKLKESSKQLIGHSQSTVESLEQVDRAVQDIAQGATSQSDETQRASSEVISMGNMIEETMETTSRLHDAASVMKDSSDKVKDILKNLGKANEHTREAINTIYEQTNETNASAEKIQTATSLIASIAEQTNLLSLNASIEAARAGEAGKGFAVVASEIQHLAEQSNASAKEIEDIISVLVANSVETVKTMENTRDIVEQQNEYVAGTQEIFGDVEEQIENSLTGINAISEKVEALDAARSSVVDIVQNLSAIAEENAAGTEETSASTTLVNEMMINVSEVAGEVSDLADGIERDVNIFTV